MDEKMIKIFAYYAVKAAYNLMRKDQQSKEEFNVKSNSNQL